MINVLMHYVDVLKYTIYNSYSILTMNNKIKNLIVRANNFFLIGYVKIISDFFK